MRCYESDGAESRHRHRQNIRLCHFRKFEEPTKVVRSQTKQHMAERRAAPARNDTSVQNARLSRSTYNRAGDTRLQFWLGFAPNGMDLRVEVQEIEALGNGS